MNWHQVSEREATATQWVADVITTFVGSWLFVLIHVVWFGVWIVLPVEKYPYGLLTLIVSLEAIFLSTFVMMSQNRASDRDRAQAEADYKTNREAKHEIEGLQQFLARVETQKLDHIIELLTAPVAKKKK